MVSSGKSQVISTLISLGFVALLSSLAGFRVMAVGAIILAVLISRIVVDSVFSRLINKTVKLYWMYWVWFALYIVGTVMLFVTAKTGSNVCAWFTVASLIVGLIFQILDVKKVKEDGEAKTE